MTRSTQDAAHSHHTRPIVLVGFSGSGKSTVGPILAELLGREFVDTDTLVVKAVRKSVAEIFDTEGEASFRTHEARACLWAANTTHTVIATGGGALLLAATRSMFERDCHVAVLDVDIVSVTQRLRHVTDRPLLAGNHAEQERRLTLLFEARRSFYASFGHRVSTTDRTPVEVATELIAHFSLD